MQRSKVMSQLSRRRQVHGAVRLTCFPGGFSVTAGMSLPFPTTPLSHSPLQHEMLLLSQLGVRWSLFCRAGLALPFSPHPTPSVPHSSISEASAIQLSVVPAMVSAIVPTRHSSALFRNTLWAPCCHLPSAPSRAPCCCS